MARPLPIRVRAPCIVSIALVSCAPRSSPESTGARAPERRTVEADDKGGLRVPGGLARARPGCDGI
jgi:hypothetical protein